MCFKWYLSSAEHEEEPGTLTWYSAADNADCGIKIEHTCRAYYCATLQSTTEDSNSRLEGAPADRSPFQLPFTSGAVAVVRGVAGCASTIACYAGKAYVPQSVAGCEKCDDWIIV